MSDGLVDGARRDRLRSIREPPQLQRSMTEHRVTRPNCELEHVDAVSGFPWSASRKPRHPPKIRKTERVSTSERPNWSISDREKAPRRLVIVQREANCEELGLNRRSSSGALRRVALGCWLMTDQCPNDLVDSSGLPHRCWCDHASRSCISFDDRKKSSGENLSGFSGGQEVMKPMLRQWFATNRKAVPRSSESPHAAHFVEDIPSSPP